MSTKSRIINVPYVYAELFDSSNTSIGKFGVSQLSTTFSVGAIPTCSLQINDGMDFGGSGAKSSPITAIVDKHNTDNIHIKVVMGLTVDTIDNPGTVQVAARNSKVIDEVVFDGVVNSMAIAYNFLPMGRSNYGVTLTAIHRFADLYAFGSGGMVYASPDTIPDNTDLRLLMMMNTSSSRAQRSGSARIGGYTSIVPAVLPRCVPDTESTSTKEYKSIPEAISMLTNEMIAKKVLVPEDSKLDISTYVKGTIKPTVKSQQAYEIYKNILTMMFDGVGTGNLADTIIGSCTEANGICIVPRSTSSISLLPVSYAAASPKKIPEISADRYKSFKYTPKITSAADIQGVLVTYAGANRISDGQGNPQAGIVRGRYPTLSGKNAVRWMCLPAPKWFDGASVIYGNRSTDPNKTEPVSAIKELCDMYAADRYQAHKYSNNIVELTTDLRSVRAYTALGASFDIAYPDSIGGTETKLRTSLFQYTLSYRGNAEKSGVEISLVFNNARASNVDSIEGATKTLYSIDDADIISEFPDISSEFTTT